MNNPLSKLKSLGVIPARGGSKGIPRKNIMALKGRPLIEYTIDAARQSQHLTHFVVSTDDQEIADVARAAGASVPFMRPPDLATDSATSLPVLEHALYEVEKADATHFDIIVMLQPPTPLRTGSDIDEALEMLATTGADSVVSVTDIGANHPLRMKRVVGDGVLVNYIDQGHEDMRPRQELPPVYIRNGAVYASRRAVITEQKTMVGADCRALIMPPERSVNIDEPFDLIRAASLLSEQ
jgi:CMP-N,N'-diacetyllegionaminic acid synthase